MFSQEGIAAIRFDFRGCGESEGSLSESSPSGRWRDLQKVIDTAVISDGFNGRLGLLGSSLGGYLALLEASRNPQIRCVSVWSTPSHLRDLAKRLPEVAPVEVSPESLEELRRVELLPQLAKVRRVLVLHGEKDRQVPPEHGSRLLAALHKPKALHFLENGDHRFSQAEVRQKAVRLSLEWFHQFL